MSGLRAFLDAIRQARARPWREIPWRTVRVLRTWTREWTERERVRLRDTAVTPLGLERALLVPKGEALERLGRIPIGRMSATGASRRALAREFRETYPEVFDALMTEAEDALAHRFNLLGSGPTELGPVIDWSCDFKTGFRWPRGYVKDMVLVDPSNHADVKVPWDLSRGYQLTRLGQAFWLTEDERFAAEMLAQWGSWVDENPLLQTCNWGNAMEAAIRACNWFTAFSLTRDAKCQTEEIRERFLCTALEHGRFISGNLERFEGYPTSNHYLSDLVGLVYLGTLTPFFKESATWLETGLGGLEEESLAQVGEDGFDYEGSTNYHRLVGELLLSAFELSRQNGRAPSRQAFDRAMAMADATLNYSRPDGRAPLIGDVDNGRLHWLTPEGPDDHRSFLGLAAAVSQRSDLAEAAGRARAEGFWWSQVPNSSAPRPVAPLRSHLFETAGLAVLRSEEMHVVVHCGKARGPRGHFHNDVLSFELSVGGQPWIIDPGTYAYTSSEEDRNHFRRTSAHNTVQVDGFEINEILPGQLFNLQIESNPRVVLWNSTPDIDRFDGEHEGFARIAGGGRHRRAFSLEKRLGQLEIEDWVQGEGIHTIEVFFHFDSAVSASLEGTDLVLKRPEATPGLEISFERTPARSEILLEEDWISRGYGTRQRAVVARVLIRTELPWRQKLTIRMRP